jgi:hypothetical protein
MQPVVSAICSREIKSDRDESSDERIVTGGGVSKWHTHTRTGDAVRQQGDRHSDTRRGEKRWVRREGLP